NHPAFIASILSAIGFVVPSNIVIQNSFSSHLSSYGRYCHLSKTSFFDILTSNIRNHWISFQTSFEDFQESRPFFRDFIINPIFNLEYVGNSSTILAIPLPCFVSYPKDYKLRNELLLPSQNSFT
ncbi:17253_t:CDS:1, partial [Racocetra persica]